MSHTDRVIERRQFLKRTAAGSLTLWAFPRILNGQQTPSGARRLTDKLAVVDGGGSNVLAFSTGGPSDIAGLVLVDSGDPKSGDQVTAAIGTSKVQTLFNTHYHLDQTGNNEIFGAAGARIIAH